MAVSLPSHTRRDTCFVAHACAHVHFTARVVAWPPLWLSVVEPKAVGLRWFCDTQLGFSRVLAAAVGLHVAVRTGVNLQARTCMGGRVVWDGSDASQRVCMSHRRCAQRSSRLPKHVCTVRGNKPLAMHCALHQLPLAPSAAGARRAVQTSCAGFNPIVDAPSMRWVAVFALRHSAPRLFGLDSDHLAGQSLPAQRSPLPMPWALLCALLAAGSLPALSRQCARAPRHQGARVRVRGTVGSRGASRAAHRTSGPQPNGSRCLGWRPFSSA